LFHSSRFSWRDQESAQNAFIASADSLLLFIKLHEPLHDLAI